MSTLTAPAAGLALQTSEHSAFTPTNSKSSPAASEPPPSSPEMEADDVKCRSPRCVRVALHPVQQIVRRASLGFFRRQHASSSSSSSSSSVQSQLLVRSLVLLLPVHPLPVPSQLPGVPEQVERAPTAPEGEGFESRTAGQREGERWRGGSAQPGRPQVHVLQCGGHSGPAQQKKDAPSIALPAATTADPLPRDDGSDDDGGADAGGVGGRGWGGDERGERTDGHKMVGKPESACGTSQLVPRCSSLLSRN